MNNNAYFYHSAPIFHGKQSPEDGFIVGYAAIIEVLSIPMPMVKPVSLVCNQNKKYQSRDWVVFPKSYLPEDHLNISEIEALYNHLVFALKYEGINLLVFSCLTRHYDKKQLTTLVNIEPSGQYSRRIWFLIEWILGEELEEKEKLRKKSYVHLVNTKQQYAVKGTKSTRHLIINNLPGCPSFCPMIKKTEKLEKYIKANLSGQAKEYLQGVRKDIIQRASAFLLLKDSKASFSIEGESPRSSRAARWAKAIGQSGLRDLTAEELIRLQQLVIGNARFIEMGYRQKGGFVGEHDRLSGTPIPDHISAKWQDLKDLINGLIETNKILITSEIDAVLAATLVSFGFVFIHPFEDGNGRIHRYLIHHILAKKGFSLQGIIFPVSASILDQIDHYREILESYSHPLLDFIEWKETNDHNIEVTNKTIDFYRYFDATEQAEFLYDCVDDTINNIIPQEIEYLNHYDQFKTFIDEEFEMPDRLLALLVRFLEQGNGRLSKRAKEKEFSKLTPSEVEKIESNFQQIFKS